MAKTIWSFDHSERNRVNKKRSVIKILKKLVTQLICLFQVHCNGVSNGSVANGKAVSVGDSGGGTADKKND